MTIKEKKELVKSWGHWWHKINFGDGVISDGPDPAKQKGEFWELTEEVFRDKTVLDIGAWDGYYSFLAEKSGAKKVTALDIDEKKGFLIAKQIFESNVEYIIADIMTVSAKEIGTFDLVLYPGVLYHMKFPYLSLHKVASLVKEGGSLFLETHTCPLQDRIRNDKGEDVPMPVMWFYPDGELFGDVTNWWGPNNICVTQMLETVGFEVTKTIPSGGDRMAYHATKVTSEVKSCSNNPVDRFKDF